MINIKLFLERKDIPVKIDVVRNTNAIPISFHIADYQIPEGAEARIYLRKPSGAEVYNSAVIEENAVIVQPTTQMYAEDGEAIGQLQTIKDTTVAASFAVVFCIHKNIISDSAIESKDEFGILDTLINQAREEIKNAQNATSAANTAAESATTAANAANTGAEAATSAAESATTAADAANAGAEAATSAATSANAAADRANEAAGNIEQANIKPLAYSVSGESITAGNSAEKPLIGLTVHGRADQGSTTGAQLWDAGDVLGAPGATYTEAGISIPIQPGTYTITADVTSSDTDSTTCLLYDRTNSVSLGQLARGKGKSVTFSTSKAIQRFCFYNGKDYDASVGDTSSFKNIMLNAGSVALPWEPYTGGAPSPSLEYPQEIDIAGLGHTTGEQLWGDGDVIVELGAVGKEVGLSVPIQPGTYTITADITSSDTDGDTCLLHDMTNNVSLGLFARGAGKSVTFTTDKIIKSLSFYNGKNYATSVDDTSSFKNIMLNSGSSALPWEPYTAGKPGYYDKGISVDVAGKNLFSLDNDTVFAKEICDIAKKTNEITLTATGSSDTLFCQYVCYLAEEVTKYFRGKTITVSAKHKTNNSSLSPVVFINLYDSDNKVIADEKSIYFKRGSSVTVIVPKETAKIRFAFRVDQLRGQVVGDYVRMYDIQVEEGSIATSYEPYKTPQSVHLSTPNGLARLKVLSGGNYTDESGQQWICDEIVRNERGTGKRIQRIGIIESYASETINTAYMSTTGQLTEGGTVIYVLDDAIETDLTAEEIAALSALHTYYPTTTISNDAGCDMTAAYVTQYYQGVGDAMFYGVADNLTTAAAGTSVLDAHQGMVLDRKIGTLTDLETTARESAVEAINEVKNDVNLLSDNTTLTVSNPMLYRAKAYPSGFTREDIYAATKPCTIFVFASVELGGSGSTSGRIQIKFIKDGEDDSSGLGQFASGVPFPSFSISGVFHLDAGEKIVLATWSTEAFEFNFINVKTCVILDH